MQNQLPDMGRRKEIIDTCLKKFIEKGLYETKARDLGSALKMQPSGLYYHFKSKDEIVLECAEEAAVRLEDALLMPVINMLDNPEQAEALSEEVPDEMMSMTRFFAQVCTANKYREQMKPALCRLKEREKAYCDAIAKKLGCSTEEIAPWFFACIASMESYMIFGEEACPVNPSEFIIPTIKRMVKRKKIGSSTVSA